MSTTGSMRLLGDLLVSQGLITGWQLETALKEQHSTHEFLGAFLIRKGWLTEETLLKTLGEQMDIPYMVVAGQPIEAAAVKLFPPALLEEHTCIPIRMDATSVTVAIANPLDAWAISEMERIVGSRSRRLRLALALAKDIQAAVQRSRQQP